MNEPKFKLIIGLGNPGNNYKKTYHNIGIEALQIISNFALFKKPFSVLKNKNFEYFKDGSFIYIKPLVYMNESGKTVLSAMKYFNVKTEEIMIIHDDSDIEIGRYKVSFGKGSAGHKGIKSIIQSLKTENFTRLRMGIRGNHLKKAEDFVLEQISYEDSIKLKEVILKIKTAYFK